MYCRDLCIVFLAMNILEGLDISHFNDDILIKAKEAKEDGTGISRDKSFTPRHGDA